MAYLLMIATVVIVAVIHWQLQRGRELDALRAREAIVYDDLDPPQVPAEGVRFHPGQTWVQVHGDRLASVGATAFAANFAGDITEVRAPSEGVRWRQSDPGLTLVSRSGRQLELPLPLEGRVLAVNPEVLRDPSLIQRRPYDRGWIVRLRPRRLSAALTGLIPWRAARALGDVLRAAVTSRPTAAGPAPAFDGGEWATAFGEQLSDDEWSELRSSLFSDPGSSAAGEGAR